LPRPRAGELALTSDPDTNAIGWVFNPPESAATGDDWRPTVLMDRVVEYLRQQREPVNRETIKKNVLGKNEYIVQAIGFLLQDETIVEVGSRRLLAISNGATSS
jgi:hypothetical protein